MTTMMDGQQHSFPESLRQKERESKQEQEGKGRTSFGCVCGRLFAPCSSLKVLRFLCRFACRLGVLFKRFVYGYRLSSFPSAFRRFQTSPVQGRRKVKKEKQQHQQKQQQQATSNSDIRFTVKNAFPSYWIPCCFPLFLFLLRFLLPLHFLVRIDILPRSSLS